MKQLPLAIGAIGAEPEQSFDNFLPGTNGLAVAHLLGLSTGAAPVYLWGPAGSGKTHLLRALAQRLAQQGARAGGFSAADPTPWVFDEAWAAIVIDTCDGLDADQQQAAFALFVEAATHGTAVIAAGRVPPVDLLLREDLRTRLGWGHVFGLRPLSESGTRSALRLEADRRGVFLSDEVMDYLLTRFERDLKHLMGLLDRLDEFSLAHQRAITVPMLKQMLAEEGGA
jgi:DnaA-homolog protein